MSETKMCAFDTCPYVAVGGFWVNTPIARFSMPVCKEHGDALSQTSHWHSASPTDFAAAEHPEKGIE